MRRERLRAWVDQPDVTFLLWNCLTLIGVSVAISLLEYLAGAWTQPLLPHLFARESWRASPAVLPAPGIGAIVLFLLARAIQPRLIPWSQWRWVIDVLIIVVSGTIFFSATSAFRLTTLMSLYGLQAASRTTLDVRESRLMGVMLATIVILSALITGHMTILQVGIWLLGLVFTQGFIGLGLRERTARREAEVLLADLRVAHKQIRQYALHAEEHATLREHERLAREIHDSLVQGLAATVMYLDAGHQVLADDNVALATNHFQQARSLAHETLRESRATILSMRTTLEPHTSLSAAIDRERHRWEATGVTITVMLPEHLDLMLTDEQRYASYRIIQEALTNAVKHGAARAIAVEITIEGNDLFLTITDNGMGFIVGEARTLTPQGGVGLTAMRERAQEGGGRLEIISTLGTGTQISVSFPRSREEVN